MATYIQQEALNSHVPEAPTQEFHNFLFLDSLASDHMQTFKEVEASQPESGPKKENSLSAAPSSGKDGENRNSSALADDKCVPSAEAGEHLW